MPGLTSCGFGRWGVSRFNWFAGANRQGVRAQWNSSLRHNGVRVIIGSAIPWKQSEIPRCALSKVTSFPRSLSPRRRGAGIQMDPRLRGGDKGLNVISMGRP